MHVPDNTTSSHEVTEVMSEKSAIRTYEQIARILIERGFEEITPARVGQVCREAEMKMTCLLLVDREIRQRMRFTTAENDRAINRFRAFVNGQCPTT